MITRVLQHFKAAATGRGEKAFDIDAGGDQHQPPASVFGRLAHPPLGPADHAAAPLVLHVRVVAGTGGGPEKTILRSARYADPQAHRVAAAYIHPHGDAGIATIRNQARASGCPLWEIGESGAADARTLRSLLRLCRDQRVAIWHGHDYKSNLLGLILRRFWPMKLVTTMHGWTRESARTVLYYHVDKWCLPRYDQVIAVSPLLVEHCLDSGIPSDRITYLPNGIDADEFRRTGAGAAARRELGIDSDALVVGVVGRFSVEKGVDRAVRALAGLRSINPRAQLHLVGDGPQGDKLRRLAAEQGVADAVSFWGWQTPLQRFYEMMDMLLLPSHTEGSPNVVLEAMAMGVPVAATDVGGVRELLDGGRCGVLLGQEPNGWTAAVAPLLTSEAHRADMARRARLRVERDYSLARRMAREGAVYDRLLPSLRSTPLRRAA